MEKIKAFLRRETVLSAAVFLALLSAVFVKPDLKYVSYIDFKTIGLLFCLMVVMAGLQSLGVFRAIGRMLLGYVRKPGPVAAVLVFLCFFFSMVITNDVALLTFVPFAITVLRMAGMEPMVLPVVLLQTIGANLGSMLTPVGNPQNLYLYSRAGIGAGQFLNLMMPYTAVSFGLLGICLVILGVRTERRKGKHAPGRMDSGYPQMEEEMAACVAGADVNGEWLCGEETGACSETACSETACSETACSETVCSETACSETACSETMCSETAGGEKSEDIPAEISAEISAGRLSAYLFLFLLCLGCVAHILPWQILLAAVVAVVWFVDRGLFMAVDYSLLMTFCAFFIFIGNMGRVPAFSRFLDRVLEGREIITAVGASQMISNVPAALLLSGFTQDYEALIIGTNLGGLGTLIASMASLISYKYIARMYPTEKGRYLGWFTLVNIVFLGVLLAMVL